MPCGWSSIPACTPWAGPGSRPSISFSPTRPRTEQDIVVEIDRYIVMPAQALGYKLGQIEIRELRESATKTTGNRFDVRAFDDIVLNQGAVPLDVLEARVREWSGGR